MLWQYRLAQRFPAINLSILATDSEARLLVRARRACYSYSAIKNLPDDIRAASFVQRHGQFCLKSAYQPVITFVQHDIRQAMPERCFDLILCRNLVFTCFAEELQQKILAMFANRLRPHGWLVTGVHEELPTPLIDLRVISTHLGLYKKRHNTPNVADRPTSVLP